MALLVDTCVLVDHLGGDPSATAVLRQALSGTRVCISVISVIELFQAANLLPEDQARRRDLIEGFEVIPLSEPVAVEAGVAASELRNASPDTLIFDAVIAATARSEGLTLVTRNLRDFRVLGINPQPY